MDKLFWLAGLCYLLAAIGHLLWARDILKNTRIGKTFLILAFVLHSCELIRQGHLSGMFPIYNLRNALVYFTWCIVLLYGALLVRHRFEMLSFFTVVLVFVFILPTALLGNPPPTAELPALRDWVTALHIGLSVFSYATFCLAALVACGYLVEHRRLKEKNRAAVILRLPPLEMLDTIQTKMVNCGLTTLGIGILAGFCWATRSAWSVLAEPKILMTCAVFILYLALSQARKKMGLTTRGYSAAVITGFLVCLASFFLMNFLSHGRHHF